MNLLQTLRPVAVCFGLAEMDHDSAMEEFYEEFEVRQTCELCDDTGMDSTLCALLGVACGILLHWELVHFLKF
jgi:hypothetical protein